MRKMFVSLLAMLLLCACLPALVQASAPLTLEINAEKFPVFAADDPLLKDLLEETGKAEKTEKTEKTKKTEKTEEDALPVLLLPVKKTYELQVTVLPETVKNKRFTLSVEDKKLAEVYGSSLTGLKKGETVLTVTSKHDPKVSARYRLLVIQPVSRITLSGDARNVPVGGKVKIKAKATPAGAALKAVTWKVENEKVATVDENGVVTGIKRGTTKLTATARDGSRVRADIELKVVQPAEQITLNKPELTVDAGKTAVLKATVLPANTDNKNVVWSSSNTKVATVNAEGRVKGIALGECQIICASKTNPEVTAAATVQVQQPVTRIRMDKTVEVYAGESVKLSWKIEPANASNQKVKLTTSSSKIVTVSQDGTITGVKYGQAYVTVSATDGSEKRARIKVSVKEHVTGVKMIRETAYIGVNESATAGAQLEPRNAANKNMSWRSLNPKIATVSGTKTQVTIKGVSRGETTVIGTTEDGGYETSIQVKIGDWDKVLKITEAYLDGKGRLHIRVKNTSDDLSITKITLEIEASLYGGEAAPVNTKDGSNIVKATYSKRLNPGKSTPEDQWTFENYDEQYGYQWVTVRVTQYQIDNDWVKTIRKRYQPKYTYAPK